MLMNFLAVNGIIAQDSLLSILNEEIAREMSELSKQKTPPYYIDYRVDEISASSLTASFGSLVADNTNNTRILTATIHLIIPTNLRETLLLRISLMYIVVHCPSRTIRMP